MDSPIIKEISFSRDILAISVGKPFGLNHNAIIIGSSKGRIDILDYQTNELLLYLETKSGDISHLLILDATKFNMDDLIVGDCDGLLTIFSNRQILSSYHSHIPISALEMDIDHNGSQTIVIGNTAGCFLGFSPDHGFENLTYKVNLTHNHVSNTFGDHSNISLLSAILQDVNNIPTHYLLVSNGSKRLFFYNHNDLVFFKDFPHHILSLLKGNFTNKIGDSLQIAIGTLEGIVYIFENFDIKETITLDGMITKLLKYKHKTSELILCCGEFNGVKICSKESFIHEIKTNHPVDVISVGDIDQDGEEEVIIGSKQNQHLSIYKLSFKLSD